MAKAREMDKCRSRHNLSLSVSMLLTHTVVNMCAHLHDAPWWQAAQSPHTWQLLLGFENGVRKGLHKAL